METAQKIIRPSNVQQFPLLTIPSQKCIMPLSAEIRQTISEMKDIVIELGAHAVGLAAVQIGVPRSIFVARMNNGELKEFINPEILYRSNERKKKVEGCLSLPGLEVRVKRPKRITLKYYDIYGTECTKEFVGMEARIIGHEMDHCLGITIQNHLEKQVEKHFEIQAAERKRKNKKKRKRR